MKNVYGSSSKYVLQYFKMLQGLPDDKTHLSCLKTNKDDLYTEDFIEKGISVFKKALKAADDEETLKRVESAALPVYYIQCRNNPRRAIQDGSFELFKKMAQGKSIVRLSESDKGDDILHFTDDLEKKEWNELDWVIYELKYNVALLVLVSFVFLAIAAIVLLLIKRKKYKL